MKKKLKIMIFVVILSAMVLTSCGGGGGDTPPASDIPAEYAGKTNPFSGDASATAAGKEIYDVRCASCHGPEGKGDGPAGQALNPPASDLSAVTAGDDYEFYRISEGGAMEPYNSAMPAHKSLLTEEEIWQVVAYVNSLK